MNIATGNRQLKPDLQTKSRPEIIRQEMTQQTLWFTADGLALHGTLHLPETTPCPVVIGCHGLLSNGDSPKQIALGEKFVDEGIAFFRFDHRGCGQSEGEFSRVTSLDGRRRDLLAAVETLRMRQEIDDQRIGLFGSSLGGTTVLAAAGEIKPLAVVTVAAPVRSRAIQTGAVNDELLEASLASMDPENLVFDLSARLFEVSNILIFHGDSDAVVSFENALEIREKAAAPGELVRLEGGDHPMSNEAHQAMFMRRTIEWFTQRLLPFA